MHGILPPEQALSVRLSGKTRYNNAAFSREKSMDKTNSLHSTVMLLALPKNWGSTHADVTGVKFNDMYMSATHFQYKGNAMLSHASFDSCCPLFSH